MTEEVLEQVINSMLNYNETCASFIWHGGEPLMMGLDFFEEVVRLQDEYKKSHSKTISISNCIQTNGVLLNDKWVDFFIENDFNVSISLDGFFSLHSKNRGTSLESYSSIMSNVRLLSSRGVPFSVLTVVTRDTVGCEKELFDFFSEYEIDSFGFLPMNYGNPDDCLSAEEYGRFLNRFLEVWLSGSKPNLRIREFDEFIRGYLGQPQLLCHHTNLCDCYFTVSPVGDLYPCDCFPQNEDTKLGNVSGSLVDAHDRNRALFDGAYSLPDGCVSCDCRRICNAGCKYHRWLGGDGFASPHYYCESTKSLYSNFLSHLTNETQC